MDKTLKNNEQNNYNYNENTKETKTMKKITKKEARKIMKSDIYKIYCHLDDVATYDGTQSHAYHEAFVIWNEYVGDLSQDTRDFLCDTLEEVKQIEENEKITDIFEMYENYKIIRSIIHTMYKNANA